MYNQHGNFFRFQHILNTYTGTKFGQEQTLPGTIGGALLLLGENRKIFILSPAKVKVRAPAIVPYSTIRSDSNKSVTNYYKTAIKVLYTIINQDINHGLTQKLQLRSFTERPPIWFWQSYHQVLVPFHHNLPQQGYYL